MVKVKRCRVLYIDKENRKHRVRGRTRKILKGMGIDPSTLEMVYILESEIFLDQPTETTPGGAMGNPGVLWLDLFLAKNRVDLIIIDSMVRFMTGSENDVKDVRLVFARVKQIVERHRCCVIILHHTKKKSGMKSGSDLRGSSDFLAFADNVFLFNRIAKDQYRVTADKSRDGDAVGTEFIVEDTYDDDASRLRGQSSGIRLRPLTIPIANAPLPKTASVVANELRAWIRTCLLQPSFVTQQPVTYFAKKYPRHQIQQALNQLKEQGEISQTSKGHWHAVLTPDGVVGLSWTDVKNGGDPT